MNKNYIIKKIKKHAKDGYGEPIRLFYKGESQGTLVVPKKYKDVSWEEYFEMINIEQHDNGEYLLSFKVFGGLSILIDKIW